VSEAYRSKPEAVKQSVLALKGALEKLSHAAPGGALVPNALVEVAKHLVEAVDKEQGGFGGAPKFPQAPAFELLWRAYLKAGDQNLKDAVTLTLDRMAQGGIYDHLGGGFARYSVDRYWLVPHFEKMLYVNAQLLPLYAEAAAQWPEADFAAVVDATVAWLRRDMQAPGGAFCSALDADSEGEEGKFYVWSLAEIEEVLGADNAKLFAEIYDVTAEGNFEGHNILNRLNKVTLRDQTTEARLGLLRAKLIASRGRRIRPGFDDKVLADWNGLTIAALAKAADAFVRVEWLEAAERAFDFVSTQMVKNGRLLHSYRAGEAKAPATATDYANMIKAALALATVTGNPEYLERARDWVGVLDRHYWAEGHGGYFLAADDTGDLIVRTINALDDATPNANGTMVSNLMQLYLWTGEERYRDRAEKIVKGFGNALSRNVFSHTGLLTGVIDLLAPVHIVIALPEGGDANELRRALADVSLPNAVVQEVRAGESVPPNSPAHGKKAIDGKPTAYVCIGPQCSAPVTDAAALVEAAREGRGA